jgi:hypothetical protein
MQKARIDRKTRRSESMKRIGEWIDVNEIIPFKSELGLLCADVNCDIYKAYFNHDKNMWLNTDIFWNKSDKEQEIKDVIFWMRIPELPRGEK